MMMRRTRDLNTRAKKTVHKSRMNVAVFNIDVMRITGEIEATDTR